MLVMQEAGSYIVHILVFQVKLSVVKAERAVGYVERAQYIQLKNSQEFSRSSMVTTEALCTAAQLQVVSH